MTSQQEFKDEPCFVISVAARIVGVHAQTLRYYERVGLIWPTRTMGRQRLYSMADIDRLRRVKSLTEDMGVNLAGAEVALRLMSRIESLEQDVQTLTEELSKVRGQTLQVRPDGSISRARRQANGT